MIDGAVGPAGVRETVVRLPAVCDDSGRFVNVPLNYIEQCRRVSLVVGSDG